MPAMASDASDKPAPFSVGGIDLKFIPGPLRLVFLVFGVFFFYGSASLLQEYILKHKGYQHASMLSFSIPAATALLGGVAGGFRNRRAPLKSHAAVGVLSCATIGFSNLSLLYLNFPTQIIFKSSKVIPVMIVGALFYGRKHTAMQYVSAVVLIVGLVLFVLGDTEVSPNFDPLGLAIVGAALLADAFIGNVQQAVLQAGSSKMETLCYANLFSSAIAVLPVLLGDDPLVTFRDTVADLRVCAGIVALGVVNFAGLAFVLCMIASQGAAQTVFWTSIRKACTIAVSVIVFPKPLSFKHLYGIVFVAAGIALNIRAKQAAKQQGAKLNVISDTAKAPQDAANADGASDANPLLLPGDSSECDSNPPARRPTIAV